MKHITAITIDQELSDQIDSHIRENDTTRSQFVRRACRYYLASLEPKRPLPDGYDELLRKIVESVQQKG